jgi:ABC-type multidrug transport system ATPase subunit
MDPEAYRSMRSAIKEFNGNRSIVLTTHSLDEPE